MPAELLIPNGGLTARESQISEVSNAIEKYRHQGVMAERERCAKIAESRAVSLDIQNSHAVATLIAEEIRRGE